MKDFITTLDGKETRDLAEFIGLTVSGMSEGELADVEVAIERCPSEGLKDDDDSTGVVYGKIAYISGYLDEGCIGLGDALENTND